MKAELIKAMQNGKQYEGKCFKEGYKIIEAATSVTILTCKVFSGHQKYSAVWYASIWTHYKIYTSGYGQAGGGGYHKPSAAIGGAINSAGFKLSESINGVGDSAIREALLAVGRALTKKKIYLIEI